MLIGFEGDVERILSSAIHHVLPFTSVSGLCGVVSVKDALALAVALLIKAFADTILKYSEGAAITLRRASPVLRADHSQHINCEYLSTSGIREALYRPSRGVMLRALTNLLSPSRIVFRSISRIHTMPNPPFPPAGYSEDVFRRVRVLFGGKYVADAPEPKLVYVAPTFSFWRLLMSSVGS